MKEGLGFVLPERLGYWDGLSTWAQSPIGAAGTVPLAVSMLGSTTAYSLGVLTPLLVVLGVALLSGGSRSGGYRGGRR